MGIGSLFHTRARALPTGSVPLTGPVEAGDIVGLAGQVDITGEQALAVPAVLRGVTLLSSAAAALPLRALDARGAEVAGTVLADPNPRLTSTELVRQVAWSMLVEGDAFVLVTGRDAFGYPTDVQVISPRLVGVELDPNTNLPRYRVGGQEWPRADVVHIPYQSDPGAIRGTSPLRRCRQAVAVALGAILFAGAYFGQAGAPTSVLKVNSPDLTPAEATALKAAFLKSQRTRTPLILNGVTDLQDNKVSAEQMELVAAQQHCVAEVARVLGLSPEDLGGTSGGSLTYSSPAARRDEFQRLALLPVVVAIEDGLSRLLPPGQRADVDMDAGLRPLPAERYANYALAIEAGFMDPGTAARLEGLPAPTPRPGLARDGSARSVLDEGGQHRGRGNGGGGGDESDLYLYWTAGEGRARWSGADRPLLRLYELLIEKSDMTPEHARETALAWFADAMGRPPRPSDGVIPT